MHRQKVLVAAAAMFALGVAFAAQPTSLRADWGERALKQRAAWVPGSDSLMAGYEPGLAVLAPPR